MRYAALLRGINVGGKNMVPMADLARYLEDAVGREFAVRTRVLVLSGGRVRRIADALPPDWERSDQWSCNVLYLFPEYASPRALAAFGADPEREEARHCAGAILHRVGRAHVGRSMLYRMDKDLSDAVTIRTCRTARKLAALVSEPG